jgi:hypothetical protein
MICTTLSSLGAILEEIKVATVALPFPLFLCSFGTCRMHSSALLLDQGEIHLYAFDDNRLSDYCKRLAKGSSMMLWLAFIIPGTDD